MGVGGYISSTPDHEAQLYMLFDTDPEKQERLMQVIHEEVQTILKDGPLADDLHKTKESMRKDYEENLEKNGYWDGTILPRYYLLGINYLTDYAPAVRAITAETVQQMLQRLTASGNILEVVMMPE